MKGYFKSDIKRGQLTIMFFLILIVGSSFNDTFCQKNQAVPTRQSSMEAFSNRSFEQAYSGFSQLLLKYPKDPLYKYFSGACLVMMKRDPDKALTLLQQSLNGASVVKSLPQDALFYLGRAQQMSGKFSEALDSYALYTEQIGKKAAREQRVPEFIQECNDKKGIVASTNAKPAEIDNSSRATTSPAVYKFVPNYVMPLPVVKDSTSRIELPASYENILDEALELQFKADSINLLVVDQKKELDKLPDAERSAMKVKISENEFLATSFQKSADQKYNEVQVEMKPKQEKRQPETESMKQVDKNIKETDKQADTIKKVVPVIKKPVEIYTAFKVLPKQAASPDEKITIDPEVPAGLIYRIQIAVFRNTVVTSYFRGITPVYGFKVTGTDKISYYAGMFRRSSDAKKALLEVKETGFKDAFIVALSGGKTVSADRAAILEKEWGNKPFVDLKSLSETPPDTIPPTLSFRVEVARSLKPLKEEVVEGMRKMAGNRGLDIQHLEDGNIAYLIGKFITFESAAEYADLLIRNNYRGARVVAWLGMKEVPVETARQLFNNL